MIEQEECDGQEHTQVTEMKETFLYSHYYHLQLGPAIGARRAHQHRLHPCHDGPRGPLLPRLELGNYRILGHDERAAGVQQQGV